ncbi:MAG: penicillin-binding protein, partial [Pontibacter sp.]|nr:penicillin-binding protein [Pontibacter sp.]
GQGSRTALPIWGEYIRRIALDPTYKGYYSSRFEPLPPRLQESLNCESYRAEPPQENFLERMLDKVGEKAAQTFEEWKESWKQRRKERKKERRRGRD